MSISIHAPREGGDMVFYTTAGTAATFQSTPPVRGATLYRVFTLILVAFQSTPPVRGATVVGFYGTHGVPISIHAPREGGDL